MTKKELNEAIISIDFPKEFIYELKFILERFVVIINDKAFVVQDNKFTKEVLGLIKNLKVKSIIRIEDFKYKSNCESCCSISFIHPLEIMIVEDNYFLKNNE